MWAGSLGWTSAVQSRPSTTPAREANSAAWNAGDDQASEARNATAQAIPVAPPSSDARRSWRSAQSTLPATIPPKARAP